MVYAFPGGYFEIHSQGLGCTGVLSYTTDHVDAWGSCGFAASGGQMMSLICVSPGGHVDICVLCCSLASS